MRHKHADLMIQAAENWDGLEVRFRNDAGELFGWLPLTLITIGWREDYEYELRPIRRPVFQRRVEVPRWEWAEAPREAQDFFVPDPSAKSFYSIHTWSNLNYQRELFKRGLVYLRAEDAAARGRAMVETEVEK